MRKWWKAILVLVALAMSVSLFACGQGGKDKDTDPSPSASQQPGGDDGGGGGQEELPELTSVSLEDTASLTLSNVGIVLYASAQANGEAAADASIRFTVESTDADGVQLSEDKRAVLEDGDVIGGIKTIDGKPYFYSATAGNYVIKATAERGTSVVAETKTIEVSDSAAVASIYDCGYVPDGTTNKAEIVVGKEGYYYGRSGSADGIAAFNDVFALNDSKAYFGDFELSLFFKPLDVSKTNMGLLCTMWSGANGALGDQLVVTSDGYIRSNGQSFQKPYVYTAGLKGAQLDVADGVYVKFVRKVQQTAGGKNAVAVNSFYTSADGESYTYYGSAVCTGVGAMELTGITFYANAPILIGKYTLSSTLTVEDAPTVKSISITNGESLKTEYVSGDTLVTSGIAADVTLSTEQTFSVADAARYLAIDGSAYDKNAAGSYDILVAAGAVSDGFTVTVSASDETGFTLDTTGVPKLLTKGTEVDLSALKVIATYSSAADDRELAAGEYQIECNPAFNKDVVGEYVYTVTYKSYPAQTFTVSVVNNVTSIALSGGKTSFAFGEAFEPGDLAVTATYEDNSQSEVPSDSYTLNSDAYRRGTPGTVTITVTFQSKSATYEVTQAANEVMADAVWQTATSVYSNAERGVDYRSYLTEEKWAIGYFTKDSDLRIDSANWYQNDGVEFHVTVFGTKNGAAATAALHFQMYAGALTNDPGAFQGKIFVNHTDLPDKLPELNEGVTLAVHKAYGTHNDDKSDYGWGFELEIDMAKLLASIGFTAVDSVTFAGWGMQYNGEGNVELPAAVTVNKTV